MEMFRESYAAILFLQKIPKSPIQKSKVLAPTFSSSDFTSDRPPQDETKHVYQHCRLAHISLDLSYPPSPSQNPSTFFKAPLKTPQCNQHNPSHAPCAVWHSHPKTQAKTFTKEHEPGPWAGTRNTAATESTGTKCAHTKFPICRHSRYVANRLQCVHLS